MCDTNGFILYPRPLNLSSNIAPGSLPITALAITNSAATNLFLRGDGIWASVAGYATITSNQVVIALGNDPFNGTNLWISSVPLSALSATGLASAAHYLRGDGVWTTIQTTNTFIGGTNVFWGVTFETLTSSTPSYINVTNTVGGSNGFIYITGDHLTNMAAFMTNSLLVVSPTFAATNYLGLATWDSWLGTNLLISQSFAATNYLGLATWTNWLGTNLLVSQSFASTNYLSLSLTNLFATQAWSTQQFLQLNAWTNWLATNQLGSGGGNSAPFTNLTTTTPDYITITNSAAGTNGIITITASNLTNIGSWLTGAGLFDAAGLAATLTGNLSNWSSSIFAPLAGTNVFTGSTNQFHDVKLASHSTYSTGFVAAAVLANAGGTNYAVNDVLGFDSGTALTNATVTVGSLAAATATIANGGSGFVAENQVTAQGGTGTAAVFNVTISAGAIASIDSIATGGDYSVAPGNPVTVTAGAGSATFNIIWGVGTVSLTEPGFYTVKVDDPSAMTNAVGSGVGATVYVTQWATNVTTNVTASGVVFADGRQTNAWLGTVNTIIPLNGPTVPLDFLAAKTNEAWSVAFTNAQTTFVLTNMPASPQRIDMILLATCGVTGTIVMPPELHFEGTIPPVTNVRANTNYTISISVTGSNYGTIIVSSHQP